MTRLPASEVREAFAETLNRVAFGKERVVLHRHGKDVAALISMEDLSLLQELEDRHDAALAKEALEAGEFLAYEEVRKDLGL